MSNFIEPCLNNLKNSNLSKKIYFHKNLLQINKVLHIKKKHSHINLNFSHIIKLNKNVDFANN